MKREKWLFILFAVVAFALNSCQLFVDDDDDGSSEAQTSTTEAPIAEATLAFSTDAKSLNIVPMNESITLSAEVSANTVSYQWYESSDGTTANASAIQGATGTSFEVPAATSRGIRYYYCTATTAETKINSSVATVVCTGLPVVQIDTVDSEEPTADQVSPPAGCYGAGLKNATKVPARMRLHNAGTIVYDSGEYVKKESGLTIKLRGNTSAYGAKKPYKLKLQKKADLLSTLNNRSDSKYQDKDWILLKDGTSLNTFVGMSVADIAGTSWTPEFAYVNVVINGEFPEGDKRASLGSACAITGNTISYYHVKTGSDMKIKIRLKDKEEKQNVFRSEYMVPGNLFTGYIAVDDDAHEVLEMISDVIEVGETMILGNARASGMGKCTVTLKENVSANNYIYAGEIPQDGVSENLYMVLLSNTVMRDEFGKYCGLNLKALEQKLKPIVVINKIDKPNANIDLVKQGLSERGLIPEDWGGDTIMVPVSARSHEGIDDLLEMILLVAEVKELKANPKLPAHGTIVEAKLDKGRGPVATVLIQRGTLTIGDYIIAGTAHGRVRALINDRGEKVRKAGPSTPVEALGLNEVPQAGDILDAVDEKIARSVAEKRVAKAKAEQQKAAKVSLDDIFSRIKEGELKELNIVVKADVQGSVEALCASLAKIQNEEVKVSVVHSGVGAINESDVMLASAANALIIGFNVRPDANARKVAENEKVDIRPYRVIYDAINDVEAAIKGMLAPKFEEDVIGRVEVRQVITISKLLIAGCYVTEGKVTNSSKIRVVRDGIVIAEDEIESLRRFKDDVKEVASGYECGITLAKFHDIKEGDQFEVYVMKEVAPE